MRNILFFNVADGFRPELAWLGTETNQFGTDEFMKWCEVLGTEPYLCFNFGTGTLDEGAWILDSCEDGIHTKNRQLWDGWNTAMALVTHTMPTCVERMAVKNLTT